ncbi:Protein IQ-DOMAIN 14 [Rhynchospora pubera]|uniref:Protein IQ-DOMAIN 14 n=1 Tax=Rhynchospora pubera TaxID=906938 RepID=A0AAV8H430_9POAL|nr:Protein IQ-DOMAIN 14 [Rhynchospora pubera]
MISLLRRNSVYTDANEMGKKGNWFSAIKKAFTGSSKDKPVIALTEKKNARDKKKWVLGKPKNGEINTFIPLCREPSSIEKILGDAEKDLEQPYKRHNELPPYSRSVENERAQYQSRHRRPVEPERDPYHNRRSVEVYNHGDSYRNMVHQVPPTRLHHPQQQVDQNRLPRIPINRFEDRERELEQKSVHQVHAQKARNESDVRQREAILAPKRVQMVHVRRPKLSPNVAHSSALRIQTAFRGFLARRNYRALKGLIRLQTMMRGHGINRQTMETMKCMQLLVKVQTQIHARRIEMMEKRASQPHHTSETDGIFGRWITQPYENSWNDSVLTKEEVEVRMRRKVEAVMKRERALAYAYSHQILKATPAAATAILADLHAGANQWCWTPYDRHQPDESYAKPRIKLPTQTQPEFNTLFDRETPDRSYAKPRIKHPIHNHLEFNTAFDRHLPDESYAKPKIKHPIQTQLEVKTPLKEFNSPKPKFKLNSKPKSIIKDDDSLTSCPPFTVPNYMAPTLSAKAKVKARVQERHDDKRRFSFGLGQGIKWGKGSFWNTAPSERISNAPSEVSRRHRSTLSVASGFSIDSAVSMPVVVGRRPFK